MTATMQMLLAEVAASGGTTASSFLARTSGLDGTHVTAYTDLLNGLDTDGLTAKFDVLHIYATQDTTTAQLNLISPSYSAVLHGSPTFTADRGYTGSAGSSTVYIDTQFIPATAPSPQITQNSAHASCWTLTDLGAVNASLCGYYASGNEINIIPRFTDGKAYFRINSNGSAGVTNATGSGHFLANRSDSTHVQGYKNGSNILTNTSDASVLLQNSGVLTLGLNLGGTPSGYGGQEAMFSIGSALNSTEAGNFYTRLRTFMTAVGVP